ncbi:MAG: lipocalin family protein [Rikenellaceae bacterium]|jgi:lipocalin|nr:lipocalin family protein [Rikenellaceae bacterium]
MRTISNAFAELFGVATTAKRHNTTLDRSVVRDFEIEDFAGVWYQIARLEGEGERELSNVSATFLVDADGMIEMHTEGFNPARQMFEVAHHRVYVPDSERSASMKVAGLPWTDREINILEVDADYNFALVGGRSADRLWILSRVPFIPVDDLSYLVARALERGYDISGLTFPDHCPVLSQEEALALAV